MKKIAIFASGAGTNAQKIIEHFKHSTTVAVSSIYTNKPNSGVTEIAKEHGINLVTFSNQELKNATSAFNKSLKNKSYDLIVLAGFLALIPAHIIHTYSQRIINIHPSLLPKHGGTGMYGSFVHQAVLNAKEKETGISIHMVNEEFDKGEIIKQYSCNIEHCNDYNAIASEVQKLEYAHFSNTIETVLLR